MIFARFFHQSPALCLIPGGDKCMKSHAWEQRKIKDLAANTYGGGTPSTSNPDFWEGSIPWIQSSDLSEHNLFRVRPRKFISQAAVTNSPVKIIPESSIAVITRVGVGKLAVMNFSYTTSQDFLSLSNLNTDVKFTSYQLYRRLQKDLNAVQGTSIKGITKEELLGKNIFIPGRQEQEAIGKFFSKIDSLLTLHQRKWVEFFYPTYFRKFSFLNFWEFFNNRITNAWEQRKIKDLAANTYGGGTPSTSNPDFWEGSIPWIQSSDLSEHNLFRVRPRKFISQAAVTNSPVKIIPESSIAVITRVGVGKLAVMNFSYTTSQDFLSLSNLNTDVKFTSYQLYRRLQKDLNAVQGTSIKGITKEELLGKNIFIPGRQEQEAIGKFFSKIDSLLTLHQRQSVSSDLLGASLHL